jgi:ferredoxin
MEREKRPISPLANNARTAIIAVKHKRASNRRGSQGNAGMSGKLKIHVDQEKCQGHARCKSLAPELFELDEFGNAHEIGDGTVPEGLEDKAWLAKANCPEIAIDVIEE